MENEFPKCVYLGNDINNAYRVVMNEEEAALAAEEGFGVDPEPKAGKKAK